MNPAAPADLVLTNGNVITMAGGGSGHGSVARSSGVARARAIAIRGNAIQAAGSDEEVVGLAGPGSRRIDLGGRTVLPGLIDAHVHATHVGLFHLPRYVHFDGCRSIADMLEAIAAKAAATDPGEWLLGAGHFDYDLVAEGRFPYRWELDEAAPHNPFSMRIRGHLLVANSRALETFGIGDDTPTPPGGHIFRDHGRASSNGWLLDNAVYHLALPKLPKATDDDWTEATRIMERRFLQHGVTTVVNQSGGVWRILERLRDRGDLQVRWQANVHGGTGYFDRPAEEIPEAVRALGPPTGHGDNWLRVGAIGEIHSDGLVEGAFMREPYAEHVFGPGWRGLLRHEPDILSAMCRAAAETAFQMEVHASGDAALDLVLDIYEKVDREVGIRERRWIITHGGVFPSPAVVERVRRLGVIVSTQQPVLWTQSRYYRRYWGEERAANLFANRTWLDGGVVVTGSSDVGISPFLGMYTYVTRKNYFGEPLGPEQGLTKEEALRLFTTSAAYSMFEEGQKGSIEPGRLADLAVVSDDPLIVPDERLKEIRALMTIVDGRIAHQAPEMR